jgi:hypothetical protein
MELPVGEHYRKTFASLRPALPRLRDIFDHEDTSDTELCFRALYAAMLYRIKGEKQSVVEDTLAVVSPVIAELAAIFRGVERGEINLFEE